MRGSQAARKLRRESTHAETQLWRRLRNRQLAGLKFRRQYPLGPYIVDFICFEQRVIVELDGGHHATQADQDAERDAWLSGQGFVVLRIWNNEVLDNMEGVLGRIETATSG